MGGNLSSVARYYCIEKNNSAEEYVNINGEKFLLFDSGPGDNQILLFCNDEYTFFMKYYKH